MYRKAPIVIPQRVDDFDGVFTFTRPSCALGLTCCNYIRVAFLGCHPVGPLHVQYRELLSAGIISFLCLQKQSMDRLALVLSLSGMWGSKDKGRGTRRTAGRRHMFLGYNK